MSAESIVNQFIQAIEHKDIDAAIALTAPDISYENMPVDPIVGRDGVRATLAGFLEHATSVDWQITRQWSIGSTVINERLDRFQIGDGWLELPVAGIFEIDDDGLIRLWRDYFDMGSYVKQITALTS